MKKTMRLLTAVFAGLFANAQAGEGEKVDYPAPESLASTRTERL